MSADAGARFAELVAASAADVALDEAALCIAAQARPDLDIPAELARLDALAAGCPEPTLDGLLSHLFSDLAFHGDRETFSDPRNSYLDEVITRRCGIPISLSVLTMEVGRRLGLDIAGVGMPGHFLIRHLGEPPVIVDPFGGGRLLDEAECEEIFRNLGGTGEFLGRYLEPTGARAILARMLSNLRITFLRRDLKAAIRVMTMHLTIPGIDPGERGALARALGSMGHFATAGRELDRLAEILPPDEAAKVRAEAQAFRSRAN